MTKQKDPNKATRPKNKKGQFLSKAQATKQAAGLATEIQPKTPPLPPELAAKIALEESAQTMEDEAELRDLLHIPVPQHDTEHHLGMEPLQEAGEATEQELGHLGTIEQMQPLAEDQEPEPLLQRPTQKMERVKEDSTTPDTAPPTKPSSPSSPESVEEMVSQAIKVREEFREYFLENWNESAIMMHLGRVCADPSSCPDPTLWNIPGDFDIARYVKEVVISPDYIDLVWPGLYVVMGDSIKHFHWTSCVLISMGMFDTIKILPVALNAYHAYKKKEDNA